MKTAYVRTAVLGMLCLGFVVALALSAGHLPDRLATHFNLAGAPDGWMSRTSYLVFMAAFGLAMPSFVVGLCFACRFLPASLVNIPHRDYWFAPERRTETCRYLLLSAFWPAGIILLHIAGLHYLVVQANSQGAAVAHLSGTAVLVLAVCFLAGMTVWSVNLIRHFKK